MINKLLTSNKIIQEFNHGFNTATGVTKTDGWEMLYNVINTTNPSLSSYIRLCKVKAVTGVAEEKLIVLHSQRNYYLGLAVPHNYDKKLILFKAVGGTPVYDSEKNTLFGIVFEFVSNESIDDTNILVNRYLEESGGGKSDVPKFHIEGSIDDIETEMGDDFNDFLRNLESGDEVYSNTDGKSYVVGVADNGDIQFKYYDDEGVEIVVYNHYGTADNYSYDTTLNIPFIPAIESGDAGKVLKVNSGETGIEWGDGGSSGSGFEWEEVSLDLANSTLAGLYSAVGTTTEPKFIKLTYQYQTYMTVSRTVYCSLFMENHGGVISLTIIFFDGDGSGHASMASFTTGSTSTSLHDLFTGDSFHLATVDKVAPACTETSPGTYYLTYYVYDDNTHQYVWQGVPEQGTKLYKHEIRVWLDSEHTQEGCVSFVNSSSNPLSGAYYLLRNFDKNYMSPRANNTYTGWDTLCYPVVETSASSDHLIILFAQYNWNTNTMDYVEMSVYAIESDRVTDNI